MSDDIFDGAVDVSPTVAIITGRKISVVYERKTTDGNYGGTTCRTYVEGTVANDANEGQIAEAFASLFMPAVAAVLDQLGIGYEIDGDQIVREKIVAPTAIAMATPPRSVAPSGEQHVNAETGLRVLNAGWTEELNGPLPIWLINECRKSKVTAVFDNRGDATPQNKKPWFKEGVPRGGAGHGKDGEARAFWPPK